MTIALTITALLLVPPICVLMAVAVYARAGIAAFCELARGKA